MQCLFLMLGYPGSGKTTFSKLLAEELNIVRINSDEIRKEMFTSKEEIVNVELNPYVMGALNYASEAVLRSGGSIIYDANHNQTAERLNLKNLADKYKAETITIWINVPFEIAKSRELDRRLNNKYVAIPDKRYEELINLFEKPHDYEQSIVIDGEEDKAEQLKSFKNQFADFNF